MNLILTHYKFDEKNVPLFDSKQALYEYFENKEDKVIIENVNFDAGDLLRTAKAVVEINDTLSLFKILNYNYCLVINGTITETLYFKINKSYQDNGPFVKLELELDAWNTYGLDLLASNPQALIKRAMLSRYDFTQKQNNTAPFNYRKDSPLFERESIQDVAKRTTDKTKLKFIIDTTAENSTFNNFLNDNILCWKYYFLSSNISYTFKNLSGQTQTQILNSMRYLRNNGNAGDSNFVVICAPIYKSAQSKFIYFTTNQETGFDWNDGACKLFIEAQQNKYANVKAIKYSFIPPFKIDDMSANFVIHSTGNMFWINNNYNVFDGYLPTSANDVGFAVMRGQYIDDKILLTSKEFKAKYLTQSIENEPKMYNEDYATYRLFIGGQQIDLPVSKTSFAPKFYYHEILTPEITKGMICYATSEETIFGSVDNNVFSTDTEENLTGFSFTIDFSLWIANDAYDNYIANNKNYLQIIANNNLIKGIGGAFAGSIAGGIGNGSIAGGIQGIAGALFNQIISMRNAQLTLDNMRNTPQNVSNINSDPLLIDSITKELGIYIEIQEPLEHEQKMIKDYFKQFGYTYNRLGLLNNFIKTRKYFNYIEADINDIDIDVSEDVKRILKNLFSNGIRFWHDKNIPINYDYNNYELEWEQ